MLFRSTKPFVTALTTAGCTHRVARVTVHTYLHIQYPVFGFWEPGHNNYLVYMISQPIWCNINLSSRYCGAGVGIFMKRLYRLSILNPSVPKGTTGLEPAAYGLFRPLRDRRLVRSATPAPVMGVEASGLYLLVIKFQILRLSDRALQPVEMPPRERHLFRTPPVRFNFRPERNRSGTSIRPPVRSRKMPTSTI